jgi:CRP/FNR family cyclic AMP-dependent transcriptional regulator
VDLHVTPRVPSIPGGAREQASFAALPIPFTGAVRYDPRTTGHVAMTASILEAASSLPVTVLGPRGVLVAEGAKSGKLYVLKSGDLEVVRDGSVVAGFVEPGSVVGEMSVLLDAPHTATVRSRMGAEVHVVDDPIVFLEGNPSVARHIAMVLAQRLQKTTALLVDMRHQAKEREDHEMFDKILALIK